MTQYINQDVNDTSYQNRYTVLKQYILHNLGFPLIRVELTEEHLLTAIIDAVTMYHRYAVIDYNFRWISGVTNPFPLPHDINKEMMVDVIFAGGFFDNLGAGLATGGFVGEFEGSVIPIFNTQGTLNIVNNFNLAQYYSYLQKLEDVKRIVGLDQLWEIINDKVYCFPKSNPLTGGVGLIYKGKLTDSENEENIWIKKYALARAKMILGTIRSKLSGITSAGINIAADGEALKSEAKEEITALETRLDTMGRPMPILQVFGA